MYKPEFGETGPFLPEGASAWETQEVRFLWGDVFRNLEDAESRIANLAEGVLKGHFHQPGVAIGNASQRLAMAAASIEGLSRVIQGIQHRLALKERGEG